MSILRASGLNAVIVIVISLGWLIPTGASGVLVLKKIEVNSNAESKDVRLEFDGEFSEIIWSQCHYYNCSIYDLYSSSRCFRSFYS